jgi:hypothetical protein
MQPWGIPLQSCLPDRSLLTTEADTFEGFDDISDPVPEDSTAADTNSNAEKYLTDEDMDAERYGDIHGGCRANHSPVPVYHISKDLRYPASASYCSTVPCFHHSPAIPVDLFTQIS